MRMKVRFYNLQVEVLYLLSDTLDTKPLVSDSDTGDTTISVGTVKIGGHSNSVQQHLQLYQS